MFPKDKYKAGNGKWLTVRLFHETVFDHDLSQFTLKEQDHTITRSSGEEVVLPSFPALYMAYCKKDPTEFTLAETVFGGWPHWQRISSSTWLLPIIEELRERTKVAIKSEAIQKIFEEAESGKNAYAASKFLFQGGYAPAEALPNLKKSVGRPKKPEADAEEEEAKVLSLVKDDAERIKNA